MSPDLRRRARLERRRRHFRYALLGAISWALFPFRHPVMWLLCRYLNIFFGLYYGGRIDAAFRFARLWPSQVPALVDALRSNGRPVPAVVL
ncbi:hypothetical protein [Lysobacter sp. F6437]|uniref:hypothetical protein n=1 Tax=Lysobacter sp. F6437 TaxID=3459296 RepID=UPI00403DC41E